MKEKSKKEEKEDFFKNIFLQTYFKLFKTFQNMLN
jgi:hypothetical protein